MDSGYCGTFVISWSQTETDGAIGAPLTDLTVGSQWRWRGKSVRVDGPAETLILRDSDNDADRRRRAARAVRRLMGAALSGGDPDGTAEPAEHPSHGFTVTDGRSSWTVTAITVPESPARLAMFAGAEPPQTDLWVTRRSVEACRTPAATPVGLICFTPGTLIATPDGARRIEDLRGGDRICTKDDGPQTILWRGLRRMTGARLFAEPALRPVRIRAGAMGEDRPDHDLIVSPGHRMLVKGPAAQALFNVPEVLVAARDLVNGTSVLRDSSLREVTYIHLMTGRHQVIWANGLETESFHPANADLSQIESGQRGALLALMPGLWSDPGSYGAHARRGLTPPEAAILQRDAA